MGIITGCCVNCNFRNNNYSIDRTKIIKKYSGPPLIKTKSCISKEEISKLYIFDKTIGKGYFSRVKLAYKKIDIDQTPYAIKIISRNSVDPSLHEDFLNELRIMKELDNPYVIKLFEVYADSKNYYLVQEYLSGGDIFSRIIGKTDLKEMTIKKILFQAISAINYTHSIGICHRDLKPDNILFSDSSEESDIKVIDFGLSKKFANQIDVMMKSFLGTPYFVAPEVIEKNYDVQCDMWSIGATAYMLLTGNPPFNDKDRDTLLANILSKAPDFSNEKWKNVTKEAKEFVKCLLVKNPKKRITAHKALAHNYFKDHYDNIHCTSKLSSEVLTNIIAFQTVEKFKQLVLGLLVKSLPKEELKKLNETFNAIDLDHEGFISMTELKNSFQKAGINLSDTEIDALIKRIDFDKNGKLNYSEFLIASMGIKDYFDERQLTNLFEVIDVDKTGYIEAKTFKLVYMRGGREFEDEEELKSMLKKVGNNESKIDLQTFLTMMKAAQ